MDILSLDATDQLQALAALRISARELLDASVVRMDRLNPKLNAVVSRDLDRAHASARMIDGRRARGETLGLLGGLPMTVKDTFDVEGLPASAGMKALLDRAAEDAAPRGHRRKGGSNCLSGIGANALSWAQCVVAYTARHREWLQANDARAQLSDTMRRFFMRFDVLLAPISPTAAFPHDQRPIRRRTLKCSDGQKI